MIAKELKKMFNSRRFDPKKFYKKGSSSKRNENNSKGNRNSNNNSETNLDPCFRCGLPGHMVKDCRIIQKKPKKGSKRLRKN